MAEVKQPKNREGRPLVTLDNCVLISAFDGDHMPPDIQTLFALNRNGLITLNVTVSTSLENTQGDSRAHLRNRSKQLIQQGMAQENIFTSPVPIGFTDPNLPGTLIFSSEYEINFMRHMHSILFPRIPFEWSVFFYEKYQKEGLSDQEIKAIIELDSIRIQNSPPNPLFSNETSTLSSIDQNEQERLKRLLKSWHQTWLNKKNDALGLYNHISLSLRTRHPELSVFVTTDKNFTKITKIDRFHHLGLPFRTLD